MSRCSFDRACVFPAAPGSNCCRHHARFFAFSMSMTGDAIDRADLFSDTGDPLLYMAFPSQLDNYEFTRIGRKRCRQRADLKNNPSCRTCPRVLNASSRGDQCWRCRRSAQARPDSVRKSSCDFCGGPIRLVTKRGACTRCYLKLRFKMGWEVQSKKRGCCSVSDCGRPIRRKGLCDTHDRHIRVYGEVRPIKAFRDPAGLVPYRRSA